MKKTKVPKSRNGSNGGSNPEWDPLKEAARHSTAELSNCAPRQDVYGALGAIPVLCNTVRVSGCVKFPGKNITKVYERY